MKFAHFADCHLGGWREPKLKELGQKYFSKAIDTMIQERVDFAVLSGDLFNTSLPGIDSISIAIQKLKKLADNKIPVYAIAGSHDFSPSGKTMLDVLEHAGLLLNVVKASASDDGRLNLKFTTDPKTGAKITGMLGKRGGLESEYYQVLNHDELESEEGYKIFMFHTALTELKPRHLEKMESVPVTVMPRGFDYYAGGHVHIVANQNLGQHRNVAYPGPTFPNNFSELEKLKGGNFVIVDKGEIRNVPLQLNPVISLKFDAKDKDATGVQEEILASIEEKNIFKNAIVTLRIRGTLSTGKPSDIDFKQIIGNIYRKGAFFVMKNAAALVSKEFEEIKVSTDSIENIESTLIQEHLSQSRSGMKAEVQKRLAEQLLQVLSTEKQDGEKNQDFEQRLKSELDSVLFN